MSAHPLIAATDRRSLVALVAFLGLVLLVGLVAGAATTPKIAGWYAGLAKPDWRPPNRLFGPVWTVLYVMMAVAAWRVWRVEGEMIARRRALSAWGSQLLFNLGWSLIFFGMERPFAAFVWILVLLAFVLLTIHRFRALDAPAAFLLVPYALWVGFAAVLNGAIVGLN